MRSVVVSCRDALPRCSKSEWRDAENVTSKNTTQFMITIYETDDDAQTATIKLHMAPEHPSALSLPVVRERASAARDASRQ